MQMGRRLVLAATFGLGVLLWSGNSCVLAQTASTTNSSSRNFDLSSGVASIPLKNYSSGTVSISQNGSPMTLTGSNIVTSAQLLAALQVVQGGKQQLALDYAGRAVGGSFQMNTAITSQASGFVIPQGVTAIRDVATQGALNLAGTLLNSGTIYGVSSNAAVNTAIFNAQSIINNPGAILSTVLPAGGISGMGALLPSLNLSLSASESVLNSGLISSSGNLTISSPEISNSGAITSASNITLVADSLIQNNASAQIVAQQNLSISSASIINSGTLAANTGQIAIENLAGALYINNSAGQILARLGQIKVTSLAENLVNGGDLAAKELFFESKNSTLGIDVNSMDGPANFSATCVSAAVKQGDLNVKSLIATDDPLLVSNDSDVLLPSGLGSGPLTVIAAGNIIGVPTGTAINTNGTDLIMLAGVANTTAGGITTVSGPSGMQGDIKNISGIAAGGGNITIGSYNGKLTVNGGVSTASGEGKIRIFVPGDISLGSISNVGSHKAGNCVEIISSIPDIGSGLTVSAGGLLLSGEINSGAAGAGSIQTGVVNVDGSTGNGGDFLISAGDKLTTGAIISSGLPGQGFGGSGYNGGAMSLRAGSGGVVVAGNITFNGGTGVHGLDFTAQPGGNGGNGGSLEIISGGDVLLKQLIANGGGGAGGAGSGIGDMDAGKGGDGGSGGNISIDAGGRVLVGFINVTGGNGGGGGGGCCKGGRGGDGGINGRTGQNGIQATATGELLGHFSYGDLHGGWYEGPGGGWPGYGGYGGGGGSGGWWGWVHGGEGGTGGSGGNVSISADKGVQTALIWSFGGGSGGGGGMVASGGGGASNANGGRSEDWIVQGDGPPGGVAGIWSGGGGGGGANHYFPGQNGGVYGGNGGDNSNGGPSGGGGAGGWGYGGKGGGWGPTGFGGSITLASLEGPVSVSGDLQAFSFTKAAGSVNLSAGKDITVSGVIRTDSGTQSGSITLDSTGGNVLVNGRLDANTYAYNPSGAVQISAPHGIVRLGNKLPDVATSDLFINTRTLGGPGGSVSIVAGDLISVNGSIATGGGANLTLATALNPEGNYRSGLILIGGGLNAVNVDIMTGSLRVLGGKGTNSIAAGVYGHVFIQTYGVQPFPTNFDLSSTQANTVALPGAIFTVGDASVNGTAGSISNSTRANPENAGFVTESSPVNLNNGAIQIQTFGSSASILQNGSQLQVNASSIPGKRTMVTPGQAVALYQVTRDSSPAAQTLILNQDGQVIDGGTPGAPISPQIELPSSDLMLPFSKFTLSTAGSPLKLSLLGSVPLFNLSAATSIDINGQVHFQDPTAQATVLLGDKALLISEKGSITGGEGTTISFIGSGKSPWTNTGLIEAGTVIFQGADKGVLNLNLGTTGIIRAPGSGQGGLQVSAYDFILSGGQIDNMVFSVLPAGKSVNSVTFSSTLGPSAVFGSLVAKTIKVSSTGDFTVRAVDQINASNILQVNTGGNLYILGQVQGKELTLTPGQDLIVSAGAVVNSTTRTTVLGKNITLDGTITGPAVKIQNSGDLTVAATGVLSGKSLTVSNKGSLFQSGNINGTTVLLNSKGSITLSPGSQTSAAAKGTLTINPAGSLVVAGDLSSPTLLLKPATDLTLEATANISTPVFPRLIVPGNLTINGKLQAATLSFTAGKLLTVGAGASLKGTSSVSMTSTGDMHVGGSVDSPLLTLRSNKAGVYLDDGAKISSTNRVSLTSPQKISVGKNVQLNADKGITFTANGAGANPGVSIGESSALNSSLGFITINSSFPVSIGDGAALSSATAMTIKSARDISVGNNAKFITPNTIKLDGKTSLSIGDGLDINAGKGTTLHSAGNISLGRDADLNNSKGILLIASDLGTVKIGKNSNIVSGVLAPWAAHPGRYGVSQAGSILIRSGSKQAGTAGITIDSGATADESFLSTAGGVLSLVTTGGADIVIGDYAKLESNGANLRILSSGNVLGGTADSINSNVAVNLNTLIFAGGGMDIAAGRTTPAGARNPAQFTVTPQNPAIGSATITNDPASKGGLVKVDITGTATINLSSGGSASSIDITGAVEKQGFGYLNLISKGDGKLVQFNGSTFSSGKPIAFVENEEGSALIRASENLEFELPGSGPSNPAVLKMKSGALALIDVGPDYCIIKCLSGPGHMKARISSTEMDLAPGEELGLCMQSRPYFDSIARDGIARRRFKIEKLAADSWYWRADISLMSLLENHPEMQLVRSGSNHDACALRNTILKMAAALQIASGKYGNYSSLR